MYERAYMYGVQVNPNTRASMLCSFQSCIYECNYTHCGEGLSLIWARGDAWQVLFTQSAPENQQRITSRLCTCTASLSSIVQTESSLSSSLGAVLHSSTGFDWFWWRDDTYMYMTSWSTSVWVFVGCVCVYVYNWISDYIRCCAMWSLDLECIPFASICITRTRRWEQVMHNIRIGSTRIWVESSQYSWLNDWHGKGRGGGGVTWKLTCVSLNRLDT